AEVNHGPSPSVRPRRPRPRRPRPAPSLPRRPPRGDRATLQPVLHEADRRPAGAPRREPVLPGRGPRPLRAGAWRPADRPGAPDRGGGSARGSGRRTPGGSRKAGLPGTEVPAHARRHNFLSLTSRGRRAFTSLDQRTQDQIGGLLARLSEAGQRRLTEAMQAIEGLLSPEVPEKAPLLVLRPPAPGDMGFVVHRHGALYAREYGYDATFEALVAEIVAGFVQHHDPARERCWIAERAGEVVGSVFLVKKSATVAKLRLLYVEPHARGLGVGGRLVEECVRFARQA